ncbi:endonuclease domain-containing protein [Acaryochloris sp. CCMEE 5410]|uniref:endonuclease domain-containing protein n=1 Tax=Acaryochloris sp. CCMEE 5410 TaxID=310037 RepID=UPI0002484C54|nr:endonuclease domain-containing protein [Acaryochloris sp. CCMEE 5410]KAI9134467.1 endonuclease domain-containing protein [Acaryochloris sp. CCMEE 5410]
MQHHRIRGTTPAVVAAARRLRLNLTTAEQRLWKALQKRQLSGLKFRCQHAIGSFIVDFYCPQCRLVIELDGDIHNQQVEYDKARTEQLNQLGFRVIRFHNSDVMHHLDHVLQQIRYASEQSIDGQSKSPRMGDLGG